MQVGDGVGRSTRDLVMQLEGLPFRSKFYFIRWIFVALVSLCGSLATRWMS